MQKHVEASAAAAASQPLMRVWIMGVRERCCCVCHPSAPRPFAPRPEVTEQVQLDSLPVAACGNRAERETAPWALAAWLS